MRTDPSAVQLPGLSAGAGLPSPEARQDELVCTAWVFNLLSDLYQQRDVLSGFSSHGL